MSAPVVWIVLPFLSSFILLILNKQYKLVCIIQSIISGVLGLLALLIPITQASEIPASGFQLSSDLIFLGRSISITNNDKLLIGIYYGFLFIWTISIILLKENSHIVPLGITLVSLLIAATSVTPFLYASLIIEIAVIVSVIIIHEQGGQQPRGISRFLIFMTLGMTFILLSGWYLAGGEISPVNDTQLIQATVLLGLGFIFWLAVFPFYSWIPIIFEENKPINAAFILIILPISIFFLVIRFLNGFAWLRNLDLVFQALKYLGGIMVGTGGLWVLFQTNIRRIMGFIFFISSGTLLVSLGLNSPSGYILFSYQILPRVICFSILTWSIIIFERNGEDLDLSSFSSAMAELPFSSTGLLIALFSLGGMPLLAFFPVIQILYQQLAPSSLFLVGLLLMGNVCVSIVGFRLFLNMFSRNQNAIVKETISLKYLIIVGIMLIVAIGIFPGLFLPGFQELLRGFENLVK